MALAPGGVFVSVAQVGETEVSVVTGREKALAGRDHLLGHGQRWRRYLESPTLHGWFGAAKRLGQPPGWSTGAPGVT